MASAPVCAYLASQGSQVFPPLRSVFAKRSTHAKTIQRHDLPPRLRLFFIGSFAVIVQADTRYSTKRIDGTSSKVSRFSGADLGMQNQGTSGKPAIESASVRQDFQLLFDYDFAMGTWPAKAGGGPPDHNGQDGGTVIGLVFLENGWHRTTRRETNVANLARLIVRAGYRLAPPNPCAESWYS
jgi:hypothetical protein